MLEYVRTRRLGPRSCPANESVRTATKPHFFRRMPRLSGLRIAAKNAQKPNAFLINTARGPIVNQRDLTEVLQKKKIAGAGLDVLEKEPPDPDDPILSLDNVILAPHALAWTDQLFAAIGRSVIESVLSIKNGEIPKNSVNRDVLQKPIFRQKLEQYHSRS